MPATDQRLPPARRPSAKVIAFPARASADPGASHISGVEAIKNSRVPKLRPWLVLLLAPLILVGSLVLFIAVVGVFLVWFAIVTLLVAGMVLFARRYLRRRIRTRGFPHRAIG
jgi:hypothetical protein